MENISQTSQERPDFIDPVITIEAAFIARKAKNSSYSLRSFARDIGTSPGHLSRVLNRKRTLTRQQATRIALALNLTKSATNVFVRDAIISAPENAKVSKILKDRMKSLASGSINKMTHYTVERFKAISQWYHVPIMELTYVENFLANDQWIANQIGISTIEVRDAVRRLTELGLLEKCEVKGLRRTVNQLFIDSHAEPEVRKYEIAMIDKAVSHYSKSYGDELQNMLVNSVSFPVAEELVPEIRKEIMSFQRKVLKLARGKPYQQVYQMNCQLFPITNSNKKGMKNEK